MASPIGRWPARNGRRHRAYGSDGSQAFPWPPCAVRPTTRGRHRAQRPVLARIQIAALLRKLAQRRERVLPEPAAELLVRHEPPHDPFHVAMTHLDCPSLTRRFAASGIDISASPCRRDIPRNVPPRQTRTKVRQLADSKRARGSCRALAQGGAPAGVADPSTTCRRISNDSRRECTGSGVPRGGTPFSCSELRVPIPHSVCGRP